MNLSRTQRLYGFGICFAVGFVLSLLSTLMLTTSTTLNYGELYVTLCSEYNWICSIVHIWQHCQSPLYRIPDWLPHSVQSNPSPVRLKPRVENV